MRFDYTKGKTANYLLVVHAQLIDDYYYFHYLKEANELFDKITNTNLFDEIKDDVDYYISLSIWDMKKDKRLRKGMIIK